MSAFARLSLRARRGLVALITVLSLGGAITALTLEASRGASGRRSSAAVRTTVRMPAPQARQPPLVVTAATGGPVSAPELRRARRVAARFLGAYLLLAYGRGKTMSIEPLTTAGLRRELAAARSRVTPAERVRRPRVDGLGLVGTEPGFVVATATIADGGAAAYRLRFVLEVRAGRWLVSDVRAG